MAFPVFFLISLGVFAITISLWWGFALLVGFPPPTPDQTQGLLWIMLAGFQALAAILTVAFS